MKQADLLYRVRLRFKHSNMYNNALRKVLLTKLKERNLTVFASRNNHYILIEGENINRIAGVELICLIRVKSEVPRSRNNDMTNGIGHFKFAIPKWEDKINFYLFAFLSAGNNVEFVIVPDAVLRSRFQKLNCIPARPKKAELTLQLMPDGRVFDKTNISFEGEWYWHSEGSGGRMADDSDWDYSAYLNNWDGVIEALRG